MGPLMGANFANGEKPKKGTTEHTEHTEREILDGERDRDRRRQDGNETKWNGNCADLR